MLSADEWEEVHGDEAEAALAQLATRRGARVQQEEPLAEAEGSDADMHEADDAAGTPHVALAGNGVELVRPRRGPPRTRATGAEAVASAGCWASHHRRARVHPLLSPAPAAC